jgi:hypothetical protein
MPLMSGMRRRACLGLAILVAGLGIVSCSSPSTSTSSTTLAAAPQPAGASPDEIARMVCTGKAAGEIAEVVGAKASVTAPAWTDHLYSCGYVYTEGTMVLSVKELSSWAQTYAYFGNLAQTMHKTAAVKGLGQGAFVVRDGSVVVRKDWKVLVVNISGLHGNIGSPPNSPSEVALLVAAVILGCWSGD